MRASGDGRRRRRESTDGDATTSLIPSRTHHRRRRLRKVVRRLAKHKHKPKPKPKIPSILSQSSSHPNSVLLSAFFQRDRVRERERERERESMRTLRNRPRRFPLLSVTIICFLDSLTLFKPSFLRTTLLFQPPFFIFFSIFIFGKKNPKLNTIYY